MSVFDKEIEKEINQIKSKLCLIKSDVKYLQELINRLEELKTVTFYLKCMLFGTLIGILAYGIVQGCLK